MTSQLRLYTNIPHEDGLTHRMYPYEDFYGGKARIPTPGVLPYISHIGMYGPKGLGFCAVSV